jgi:hypothetical protein
MPGASLPIVPLPVSKENMQGASSPICSISLHARQVQSLAPLTEPGGCPSHSPSSYPGKQLLGTNLPSHSKTMSSAYTNSLQALQALQSNVKMLEQQKRAREGPATSPQGQQRSKSYIHIDDDDDEDDEGLSVEDESDDESDVLKACTRALGMNKHYANDWTSADAFREFYQNW